jgi:hypothetical protein
MDANPPAAGDAELPVQRANLSPGIREPGSLTRKGLVDNVAPDASVVWVWVDGHAPRPIYLAGDPVEILPELENPDAY